MRPGGTVAAMVVEGMRGSVTSTFSEPDDFQAALRAEGSLSYVTVSRGRFHARLIQIDLHRLRLFDVREALARIAFVRAPTDTILISMLVEQQQGHGQVWGGLEVQASELVTLGPGRCVHVRSDGACHWGMIHFPADEFGRYSRALTGEPLVLPGAMCRWRPTSSAGRQLRRLHSLATRATHDQSEPVVGRETAHGLEQQMIHVVVECLSTGAMTTGTAAARREQKIAAQFEQLLAARPEGDLDVMEICAELRVTDRLLRRSCANQLGMSPGSYLRLHRMQAARRALRNSIAGQHGVADVAQHYGFHNPGRFAGLYHRLFGELPSLTLQRGPHQAPPDLVRRRRTAGRVS